MRNPRPTAVFAAAIATFLISGFAEPARGQTPPETKNQQPMTTPAPIYDESANANTDVVLAIVKARRENQRVLVVMGANWCHWCRLLHTLFDEHKAIKRKLLYEYQVVWVDIGRMDKHTKLPERWKVDLKESGVPFLVVLDGGGKVLTKQETSSLEDGPKHDPAKVLAFLEKWQVEQPIDARKAFAAALASAKRDDKRVFVHLGAPWCPWCHRLDDFLASEPVAKLIAKDFIDFKIDVDRMTHGKALAAELRGTEKGGIPWFVILDADGKPLANADGPEGNVGFPVADGELAHFEKVLRETARRMTAADVEQVVHLLRAAAPKRQSEGAR